MAPTRHRVRRMRFVAVVVVAVVLVVAALQFQCVRAELKSLGKFLKHTGLALKQYAETAGPWTAGSTLGALSLLDSSFTPLPEGIEFLVVYFSLHHPAPFVIWFVFCCSLGSVVGSLIIFAMGRKGGRSLLHRKFKPERVERMENWFRKYDFWAVFIPCILPPPVPFKFFVLSSGILGLSWKRFILATFVGRVVRYGIWAGLAVVFREQINEFMHRHLPVVGIGIAALLFILGVATWVWNRGWKWRKGDAQSGPCPGTGPCGGSGNCGAGPM